MLDEGYKYCRLEFATVYSPWQTAADERIRVESYLDFKKNLVRMKRRKKNKNYYEIETRRIEMVRFKWGSIK